MVRHVSVWTVALILIVSAGTANHGQEKLTARGLFYAAGSKSSNRPTTRGSSQPPNTSKGTQPPSRQSSSGNPSPDALWSGRPSDYSALGLRYSILRGASTGRYEEVDVDTTFRSGDGIKLSIESNDDAYLYIAAKG